MGNLSYTTAQIDAKLAPVKHKTVTVTAAQWTASGALFVRDITDADIVDGSEILFMADITTEDIASEAGIYADGQGTAGKFTLTARTLPTASIIIKYTIKL